MDYKQIDKIIEKWATTKCIFGDHQYQDTEVRSALVVDDSGTIYQLWISIDCQNQKYIINAWDYRNKRFETSCDKSFLQKSLDDAFANVLSWIKENNHTRTIP